MLSFSRLHWIKFWSYHWPPSHIVFDQKKTQLRFEEIGAGGQRPPPQSLASESEILQNLSNWAAGTPFSLEQKHTNPLSSAGPWRPGLGGLIMKNITGLLLKIIAWLLPGVSRRGRANHPFTAAFSSGLTRESLVAISTRAISQPQSKWCQGIRRDTSEHGSLKKLCNLGIK
ncbi:hypothetical protein I7I48_00202 [Histoplasma ohiense]|nr:hypothetical protein I7I48_00202 [Histoplasma ohiense (nom. inval.)]